MANITGMKLRAHLGHSLLLLYDKRLTKAFDLFTENEIKQHINYISYGLGRDRLKEINSESFSYAEYRCSLRGGSTELFKWFEYTKFYWLVIADRIKNWLNKPVF